MRVNRVIMEVFDGKDDLEIIVTPKNDGSRLTAEFHREVIGRLILKPDNFTLDCADVQVETRVVKPIIGERRRKR